MAGIQVDSDLTVDGTVRASNLFFVVEHGSNASFARPSTTQRCWWFGTVTPTNAIAGDVYTNES